MATGIVRWGAGAGTGSHADFKKHRSLGLTYYPPLYDVLDWGPQHVDLDTQLLMRLCYFGDPHSREDAANVDVYVQALQRGDEVVLWADRVLPGCLGLLWVIEALIARGADLRRAALALSPDRSDQVWLEPEAIQHALAERIPLGEVAQPLAAIRRHLASDSEVIQPDLSDLPPEVREWASVCCLLADFLPDRKGLDVIDRLLLQAVTEEWQNASRVLVYCLEHTPSGHDFPEGRVWERLMELCRVPARYRVEQEEPLIAASLGDKGTISSTRCRITTLGLRVRDKRADALKHQLFFRWVGGRLITNDWRTPR